MFSHADRVQTHWDHSNRIAVFLILTPFAFGLFYEYEACVCALLLLALLFYLIARQKSLRIRCGITTLALSALLAGYLFTPLWMWTAAWRCSAFSNFCLRPCFGCC